MAVLRLGDTNALPVPAATHLASGFTEDPQVVCLCDRDPVFRVLLV
jgi:hypothetical protein